MSTVRSSRVHSKLGCAQCRKRHVKCDEGRPDCKNCAKRKSECSFRTYDPVPRSFAKRSIQAAKPLIGPEGSITTLPSPIFLDYLPSDELLVHFPDFLRPRFRLLLNHFALETSASISHNDVAKSAWCAAVPSLAGRHRFVLQGVLALSAIHVSKLLKSERERNLFKTIATYQMNTGLIQYRDQVAKITKFNAESLFAFSSIATAWTLLTAGDEFDYLINPTNVSEQVTSRHATAEKLMARTSSLLRTIRGVLVIIIPCWDLISRGILGATANREWQAFPAPTSPEAIEDDTRLRELEKMWAQPDRAYDYRIDTFRHALKALREQFASASQLIVTDDANPQGKLIDWTMVLTWPIYIPLAFVELVEARSPEAWVLLAHYAIVAAKARDIIWMRDLGPNLLSAAALVLSEEMRCWIQWPAEVIGVDIDALLSAHGQVPLATVNQNQS